MFGHFGQLFAAIGALAVLTLVVLLPAPEVSIHAPAEFAATMPQNVLTMPDISHEPKVQTNIVQDITLSPVQSSEPIAATHIPADEPAPDRVSRIEKPYSFPPLSLSDVDARTRAALVNIFCRSGDSALHSTSGSGVLIDPQGIILTNAHLGQYFLLDARSDIDVSCVIRSGSPAQSRYSAEIVYIPPTWIEKNAHSVTLEGAYGTGEHDYALLRITETTDGSALPSAFPFLPPDAREAIAFTSDPVIVAGYPAEFISGNNTLNNLYPATTITTIDDLMTFTESRVDIVSLGGIPLAQGGSSGGAVVNAWGYLVGIVTTTSEGATTGERDLRAITLAHINRSLSEHTGSGLLGLLGENIADVASVFSATASPTLSQLLLDTIRTQ